MNLDGLSSKELTRRRLVQAAGLGGLALAVAGVVAPTSAAAQPGGLALAGMRFDLADPAPEGFLAAAFAERAKAQSSGDGAGLDAVYDPASAVLLRHEKERAAFFKRGIGDVWGGAAILDFTSSPELQGLQVTGSTATARIWDRQSVRWISQPRVISKEYEENRKRDPEGFAGPPLGPQGEITSYFAIRHELSLVKGAQGWRIAKDSYDEFLIFRSSPDLVKGSWSEEPKGGGPTGIPAPPAEAQVAAMATYNPTLARQCAQSNWSSYNPTYCNYNPCGGDCGNFVSQCLRAGGWAPSGTWYTFSGGCGVCGTSATYSGSDTWANNQMLRDFNNTSGRGAPAANQWNMRVGDIINYDWTTSAGGPTDHIVLVSATSGSGPLVAGHNSNMFDYPWSFGSINYATFSYVHR